MSDTPALSWHDLPRDPHGKWLKRAVAAAAASEPTSPATSSISFSLSSLSSAPSARPDTPEDDMSSLASDDTPSLPGSMPSGWSVTSSRPPTPAPHPSPAVKHEAPPAIKLEVSHHFQFPSAAPSAGASSLDTTQLRVDLTYILKPPIPPQLARKRSTTPFGSLPAAPAGLVFTTRPKNPPVPMPADEIHLFRGDKHDAMTAQDFLRYFRRQMRLANITGDSDRIFQFVDYVAVGSRADRWFTGLTSDQQTKWKDFSDAFDIEWPRVVEAAKTKEELQRELVDTRLADSALGEKTTVAGKQIWSHVAWADELLAAVREAQMEATDSCIWQVRDRMPDLLKQKVRGDCKTWTEFVKEIKAVSIDFIRDGVQRKARDDAHVEALQRQLDALTISAQPRTYSPAPRANSFTAGPPRPAPHPSTGPAAQPNAAATPVTQPTFNRQPAAVRPPSTPAQKAALRARLNSLPHHDDTAAGHTAYNDQVTAWFAKYGNTARVSEESPFPLRPGTAAICLDECFQCGTHGHYTRNCPVQRGNPAGLHPKERAWHIICRSELGPINRDPMAEIRLVMVDEEGHEVDYSTGTSQGNGSGLSV